MRASKALAIILATSRGFSSNGHLQRNDSVLFGDVRSCSGSQRTVEPCRDLPSCVLCIPVNCAFQSWEEWFALGGCTGLCQRSRAVAIANNECGAPCSGALTDTKLCPEEKCALTKPQDCALSDWSTWSACSQNQRTRSRDELTRVQGNGLVCNNTASKEIEACVSVADADCEFSPWAQWTPCTHSCASGYRVRTRRSLVAGCAGALRMSETCNTLPCEMKQDCVLGAWSKWSDCEFQQTNRSRNVQTPTKGAGKPCSDSMEELKGCTIRLDVVDCSFSQWSDWARCSRSCGGGQSSRARLAFEPRNGGQQCSSTSLGGTRPCNTQACKAAVDADCTFSDWTQWTVCPSECGTRTESRRSRDIATPARLGGDGCQGSLVELKACESDPCIPKDCQWGAWETWSVCTRTCGAGYKDRQRSIVQLQLYGGKSCSAEAMKEVEACGAGPCKICTDGLWGEWSSWLACSATCGDGFTTRSRFVATLPDDCGKNAEGAESEYVKCSAGTQCMQLRDCQLSAWSEWGECTSSCFGSRMRSRETAVYATALGKPCVDALVEVDVCNSAGQQACSAYSPTACVFSDWTDWSLCSATCSGEMRRERQIIAPSSIEGQPCEGASKQMKGCNTDGCNKTCVDCVWDSWSQWGDCSGCSGTKLRQRAIAQMPTACGKPCSKQRTFELTGCSVGCPVEEFCVWSSWLSLGTCGTVCGAASLTRTRSLSKVITRPADFLVNGTSLACTGVQKEAVPCPFVSCVAPADCKFSAWTEWQEGALARTCDRSRSVLQQNDEGGKPCTGSTHETKFCGADLQTPVDCVLSDWQAWSGCDGKGTQAMRSKVVLVPADRGAPCEGEIRETRSCPPKPAEPKVDCAVHPWGDWTDCALPCAGSKMRQRGFEPAVNGGLACVSVLQEISACTQRVCTERRDCILGPWTEWGACSADSQKSRGRSILAESQAGGKICAGTLSEMTGCWIAVDCVVSEWSAFAACDRSCGGGQKTRIRQITRQPSFGGRPCPSSLQQVEGCNTDSCTATSNCELGPWDAWSACSVSCGEGQTFRDRKVLSFASDDGEGCDTSVRETQACSIARCARKDCRWGDWTSWSGCPCDCGGGMQERSRRIAARAEPGGKPCEPGRADEVRPCNTQPCNNAGCVDGVWGPWTSWSACSASCQGGLVMRYRLIAVQANACGVPALGLSRQTAGCNSAVSCVQNRDCRFGEWLPWNGCSSRCYGARYRDRVIVVHATGGGSACIGALSESSGCNPLPGENISALCGGQAPVNCEVGPMSEYGVCSASCGGGQHSRSRQIVAEARNGGKACDSILKETSECNTQPCPVCQPRDCTWSDWSSWGACDKCDGQRQRFRSIAFVQSCGGQKCNDTAAIETGDCERSCRHLAYCGWSEWAPWSKCTATCGAGTRERVRGLVVKVAPSDMLGIHQLDAASLSNSLVDLDRRSQALETRRLQENVLAYALGVVSLVGFGVLKGVLRKRGARGVPQSREE